ncbi:MAG: haloacid dehalogenase type II [Thermoleophilia bacterium]|nr:haloacid dehalogenase type II [Thermoleophilia bacterium]MDH3724395.1 haloacid dehalogenase type II [Thermoleophilia bacterium]
MPSAIFDVNETMLDLSGLDSTFSRIFDDPTTRREWFARLLHLSVTSNALGLRSTFGALGTEALDATGASRGVEIGAAEHEALGAAIRTLPAHPDVAPALLALRSRDWRLIALTNSTGEAATGQLTSSGLIQYFDRTLSVEAVGQFKPAPEPYLYATRVAGVAIDDVWMVACHDWDLAGAAAVGLKTAYVERAGMTFADIYPPATVTGADMLVLARRMLEHEAQ